MPTAHCLTTFSLATRFITQELYPQLVMQRQFGAPIPVAKLNAVSTAATTACDALGLGFILEPLQCRYNPLTDSWTPMNTVGAPAGRNFHTAVWSGSQTLVDEQIRFVAYKASIAFNVGHYAVPSVTERS